MEGVLASIMARFSESWEQFLLAGGSFDGFDDRYKRAWLHK